MFQLESYLSASREAEILRENMQTRERILNNSRSDLHEWWKTHFCYKNIRMVWYEPGRFGYYVLSYKPIGLDGLAFLSVNTWEKVLSALEEEIKQYEELYTMARNKWYKADKIVQEYLEQVRAMSKEEKRYWKQEMIKRLHL